MAGAPSTQRTLAELMAELIAVNAKIISEGGVGLPQVFTSSVENHVHRGDMYEASAFELSVADDDSMQCLMITGPSQNNLVWSVAAGGDTEVEMFEDTDESATGPEGGSVRMNRNAVRPSGTQVFGAPTINADGNRLLHGLAPGGTGGNATGGLIRADTEWILSPTRKYLLRGTNRSGQAKPMAIVMQWYEDDM